MKKNLTDQEFEKRGKTLETMVKGGITKSDINDFMSNEKCCRTLNAAVASSLNDEYIVKFFSGVIKATKNQNLTFDDCGKFLSLLTNL